ELAVLAARLLLALVFAVAGGAKLADRAGSRRAVAGFGVPERLAGPLGLLLPIAELAVAIALVPRAIAWWGALGALVLLLVFVAAIGYNVARGRQPDCHCFGQIHSAPAGRSTLVRNGILAAIAAFIVSRGMDNPGPSVLSWLVNRTIGEQASLLGGLLAIGLLAGIGWVLVNLLRQNGRLLLRVEALEARLDAAGTEAAPAGTPAPAAPEPEPGLPIGTPAPNFTLSGLHGETLTLGALRAAGKPVMLLFSAPSCGPCNALLPEIGRWQREHASELMVVPVSSGSVEENRAKNAEHGITNVLLQEDNEVADAYHSPGTPSAVIVYAGGTIGSPIAAGADAVRALVARTVGTLSAAPEPAPSAPVAVPPPIVAAQNGNGHADLNDSGNAEAPTASPAPKIGDPAPTVRLPNLQGKNVNLAGFRGKKTVVLFWNPGCGFCSQMLGDLKAWEANPPADAPKLLVVSTGALETNRAMGLHSSVVLDPNFATGTAFGANGTPMAVLVDEQGKIASQLVAGDQGVLSLLGVGPQPAQTTVAPPVVATVGEPAPEFQLPDLSGKTVALSNMRGSKTLLLFWNPGCGFCARMLDELKAWEADAPAAAPKVLVVSTGTVESNQAMGLRAPVVLDQGMSVGSRYGANGTPMAVLIDEDGNIASEVAGGAVAVMGLVSGLQDPAKAPSA
ncbi:MAG: TlpA family protein disulfide reductase, partial [Chloroflexia bacterium]|nr:TlpA family protein disulfide reductase [Chloroflexia bacterium]